MLTHSARRRALALLAAGTGVFCQGTAYAAPVGPALSRPAILSQRAAQSVLLGIAQAGQRLVAVGERGIVLLSDDNAATWRQVAAPVSVTLTAVRFADSKHGYATGHGGAVLATTDGGETWVRVLDGNQAARIALEAAQASGNVQAQREAQRLLNDGPDKPLLDLLVTGPQRVVAIGAYGLAYATTDGGKSWRSWSQRLDNPRGLHLYAIRRHGENILVCGEQGLVRLSRDDGLTFTALKTPYNGSFFTAELPGADDIMLAGLRGNLLRSPDGGATWRHGTAPGAATITASALRPDGALTLATQAGTVLTERNGVLVPLNPVPLPPLTGILPKIDGTSLALSIQGMVTAPNGGQQ